MKLGWKKMWGNEERIEGFWEADGGQN